jgi:hypothetical protein
MALWGERGPLRIIIIIIKLTSLHMDFTGGTGGKVAQMFQHLSCLTALQGLTVLHLQGITRLGRRGVVLPGMQHLSSITSLELGQGYFDISTTVTRIWAFATRLQRLALSYCEVQPEALAALTQLQALSFYLVHVVGGMSPESPEALLLAVSKLSMLTELQWTQTKFYGVPETWLHPAPPATVFTALTASSNLHSLRLGFGEEHCGSPALFQRGTLHPQLRHVDMTPPVSCDCTTLGQQQLQLLWSCCPAVESLSFVLCPEMSPTAFQPLLQLSALTKLSLQASGLAPCDAEVVVGVVARLTGLKNLSAYTLQLDRTLNRLGQTARTPALKAPCRINLLSIAAADQQRIATIH